MFKALLVITLLLSQAFAGDTFNPIKEAQKKLNNPYDAKLDITCKEALKLNEELAAKDAQVKEFARTNPGNKKEIRRQEKEFQNLIDNKNEIMANYYAKAIILERVTGIRGIPYDESVSAPGYWNIEKACQNLEAYADFPLSNVMLSLSGTKVSVQITTQAQIIRQLEAQLTECQDGKNPAINKDPRWDVKDKENDKTEKPLHHNDKGNKATRN